MNKVRASVIAGLAAVGIVVGANAQTFPTRPITIVIPTGPGGPLDLIGRTLAPKLEASLGQSVIIENRTGAGAYLGGAYVARAEPDGHTLLINAQGGVVQHLFSKDVQFALPPELVAVAPVAKAPNLFTTPMASPAKDLKEFIAWIKTNPGKYNVAVVPGSALALEIHHFLKTQSLEMVEIPYNSTADITTALLRNDVQLAVGSPSGQLQNVLEGKVKALAIATTARFPALPQTPTTFEQGIPFENNVRNVVFAPAKTPPAVLKILNEKIVAAMNSDEAKAALAKIGFLPVSGAQPETAKEFRDYVAELEKEAAASGIKPK